MYQNLQYTQQGRTAIISINRPQKYNALDKATLKELHLALTWAVRDERIGGIVIRGRGGKAFAAGADIAELAALTPSEAEELSHWARKNVFDYIEQASKPVIAVIEGFALGGGLELALACHIRIAQENARMGLPEVSLGLIPGYGGTQRLPALIGKGRALEMMLSAEIISAETALQLGLINSKVAEGKGLDAAVDLLERIYKNSPLAVAAVIKSQGYGRQPAAYEQESVSFGQCFASRDFKEGVDAFLNKRSPEFTGK